VHDTAAAWVTENTCPPIVSVAARAVPMLDVTVKLTWPWPVPLPLVGPSTTQLALLVAVQEHPEPALTVTLPAPPPAGNACDGLPSVTAQL
jgi:hypothetical protein